MGDKEQPSRPPTRQLPAAEKADIQFAELKALILNQGSAVDAGFRGVKTDFNLLKGQFDTLQEDFRGMQSWRVRVDDRLARNSDRAKNPSEIDLELKAIQGLEIAKNVEQDKAITETRKLAEEAVNKLATIETAADARAKVLDGIADSVNRALKSKMAEKIAYAVGGAILAVIGYFLKKYGFQ